MHFGISFPIFATESFSGELFFMYIEQFTDYLRLERNYSERTISSYKQDLVLFELFIKGVDSTLELDTVHRDVIRMWVISMMENGEAATTVNRKLSTLRTFYKFLIARGIVEQTPVKNIKGPKVSKPLPQFVRDSEMKAILDSTEPDADFVSVRNRCILALFYETGIRLADLISLNNDDIDFGNGTLKVTGKRDKQRIIPFANRLADQLKDYMELRDAEIDVKDSDALFLNIKGGRIPRHQVYHLVKDALKESNVEKKSPHVLRHTFATSMLNNDAELGAVKELLGHNSLATTEVYVHITFQELKEIYKQAHPRA